MKRFLTWSGIIITALILQSTFFAVFAYNGIKPDLLLIIVISSALLYGKDQMCIRDRYYGLSFCLLVYMQL